VTGWVGQIDVSLCGLAFVTFVDKMLWNVLFLFGAFLKLFLFVAAGRWGFVNVHFHNINLSIAAFIDFQLRVLICIKVAIIEYELVFIHPHHGQGRNDNFILQSFLFRQHNIRHVTVFIINTKIKPIQFQRPEVKTRC
jgi:hypothetical protein